MIYAAALAAVALFVLALERFGVVRESRRAIAVSRDAIRIVPDASLDDDAKERMLQQASVTLFGAFASIAGRTIAAFAVSLVPLAVGEVTGLAPARAVAAWLATPEAIVVTSVLVVLWLIARVRR